MLCAVTALIHPSAVINRVVAEKRMVGDLILSFSAWIGKVRGVGIQALRENRGLFVEGWARDGVVVVGLRDAQGGLCAVLGIRDARTTSQSSRR